jgi:hypothetical protein
MENRAKKGFSFEYTSLLTPGGEPLLSKDGWCTFWLLKQCAFVYALILDMMYTIIYSYLHNTILYITDL